MLTELVQLKQGRPGRFLFSIRDPIVSEFNHVLQMDIVKISEGNVLHVMDLGTDYNKVCSLPNAMQVQPGWFFIVAGLICMQALPIIFTPMLDRISILQSSRNIQTKLLRQLKPRVMTEWVLLKEVFFILKTICSKLRLDLPRLPKEDVLSLTFPAINLVFSTHPTLAGAGYRGSMAQRANVLREAAKLVTMMKERRNLCDAIKTRSTPSVAEIEKVRNMALGGGCLSYTLVRVADNNFDIFIPSGKIS